MKLQAGVFALLTLGVFVAPPADALAEDTTKPTPKKRGPTQRPANALGAGTGQGGAGAQADPASAAGGDAGGKEEEPEPPAPQPWSKHFSLIEETVEGDKIPIPQGAVAVVDRRSIVYLVRTSSEPDVIRTQRDGVGIGRPTAERQALEDEEERTKLKATAFVRRSAVNKTTGQTATCVIDVPIVGLTEVYSRARPHQTGSTCPETPTVGVVKGAEAKQGQRFPLSAAFYQHNDLVDVQLWGAEIGLIADPIKCERDGKCTTTKRLVGATRSGWSLRIADLHAVRPIEVDGGKRVPIDVGYGRVDVENTVFVDYSIPDASGETLEVDASVAKNMTVEATALGLDKKERKLEVGSSAGRKTVSGMLDGDRVKIVVVREVTLSDGNKKKVPVTTTEFDAAGVGPRYAFSGNRKANYATATSVAIVFGDKAAASFAQTFAYSFYYKTKNPSPWEELAIGFHAAAVAGSEESKAVESEKKGPVSLGLGGQLTVVGDTFHIGGGYDVIAEEPYMLFGISAPDFVKLVGLTPKKEDEKATAK